MLEDLETGFAKFEEDLVDFTSSESWVRARERRLAPRVETSEVWYICVFLGDVWL